jgi:hypothetical protein
MDSWNGSEPSEEIVTPGVAAEHSVARIWNELLLNAIRKDVPKPPPHARNLFHVSAAMWDAWAAYDPLAEGIFVQEKHVAPACAGTVPGGAGDDEGDDDESDDDSSDDDSPPADCAAAERAEAISFAAYRILKYRFPVTPLCPHPGSTQMQAAFDAQMDAFGYDKTFTSTVGDSPAAVGNRIAAAILAHGQTDGAFEGPGLCYPDDTGYFPLNPDLIFKLPGNPDVYSPNNWQPLAFDYLVLQNGIIIGAATQSFVGPGWGDVVPFALTAADIPANPPPANCYTTPGIPEPYFDPGCPPQLGGVGDAALKQAMLELIRFSGRTDPTDGVLIDASPGAIGNNSLGMDDGTGHPVNPYTGEPYAPNIVKRADWQRIVAQFWSDGPQSETPPGHWNVVANEVADHPALVKRIGGSGPVVTDLEWDVKVYVALNGAVHDAAISAWSTKHYYDSSRPITMIRYMSELGQSSDPGGPSYHPDGLLLEPGLVEVVTADSILPGERHAHLKSFCAGGGSNTNTGEPCETDADCPDDGPYDGFCESSVGKIAIYAWNGPPADPENEVAGAGWNLAEHWMPWFPKTFVTPPFPGYTSGHSTFSRSAAEVLTAITGDPYVPGGLGHFDADEEYLEVEHGPSEFVQLQWATYFDAADQAGISRRFGGIHPFYDDFPARAMGSAIGQKAWLRALDLYNQPPAQGGDDDCDDDAIDAAPVAVSVGSGGLTNLAAGSAAPADSATAASVPAAEADEPAAVEDRPRRLLRRGTQR